MPGRPILKARKATVGTSEGRVIAFSHLSRLRASLSHADWRALSPRQKLERLLGMSLDNMAEILSWGPLHELDPAQLNAVVTVARVGLLISTRAGLFEKARHERDRQRILSEMTRREFAANGEA